ncbi:hypothetical protein [Paraclostridium sordellii]|uniref:hypothetical protein n=1 Tax=Paraclostridium sordellii TaxID=1505 RepID=UPI0006DC9EB7|nr:hypothetical protein [Paeniclostridium sordellii]MBX9181596.1 hypothetical protein [Paeniclostridium sordellii]
MKLEIKKLLITCNKYNIASSKTIINYDGKLENEVTEVNGIFYRIYGYVKVSTKTQYIYFC